MRAALRRRRSLLRCGALALALLVPHTERPSKASEYTDSIWSAGIAVCDLVELVRDPRRLPGGGSEGRPGAGMPVSLRWQTPERSTGQAEKILIDEARFRLCPGDMTPSLRLHEA